MIYTPALMQLQSFFSAWARPGTVPERRNPGRRKIVWGLGLAAVLLPPGVPLGHAATPPPLRAAHGMVASDHKDASVTGMQALKAGGNAVDAACATAMALGVLNPQSSGLGGGGFAVVYLAKEKKSFAIDFREKAPLAIKRELFFKDGKLDRRLTVRGGLAVAVPGEARGLADMVKRWGRRTFADCVAPAEQLAKGTPASDRVVRMIAGGGRGAEDEDFMSRVFTYAKPLRPGDTVTRPALAQTLAKLRTKGPDAFYTGEVAQEIVNAVRAAGGVMTVEDLQKYNAVERAPYATRYRGFDVYTMPLPSSGGIVISEVLGILGERMKDPASLGHDSSAHLHLLGEALKHGFADRARHLGDPDFIKVPVGKLLDPAYHKTLAGRITENGVLAPDAYGMPGDGPVLPPHDGGTAHLSVMDSEGNAVALTTTVNLGFGAHLIAGSTGIVLNNEMDDFSIEPGVPNSFKLIGTEKNGVAPGKRPLSSMSPTVVVENGQVKMAVGGAGGPTIISGTLQVMLNVLDWKMDAQAASAATRIHHQWAPNVLGYENGLPRDVIEGLERRGHKTAGREHICTVNVVVRTDAGFEGASEFRGGGAPAGY